MLAAATYCSPKIPNNGSARLKPPIANGITTKLCNLKVSVISSLLLSRISFGYNTRKNVSLYRTISVNVLLA